MNQDRGAKQNIRAIVLGLLIFGMGTFVWSFAFPFLNGFAALILRGVATSIGMPPGDPRVALTLLWLPGQMAVVIATMVLNNAENPEAQLYSRVVLALGTVATLAMYAHFLQTVTIASLSL